jgi:hypothetical protein
MAAAFGHGIEEHRVPQEGLIKPGILGIERVGSDENLGHGENGLLAGL